MAVVFDSQSSLHNGSGGTSISFSHTLGNLGSTGLIIVGAVGEDTSGTGQTGQRITGITYNGVAMTLVVSDESISGGSHSTSVAMYALRGTSVPVAGTYTVTVSYAGSHEARAAGCMSFKNVKNQAAEATASINAAATDPLSTNITPISANAVLVMVYGNQNDMSPVWSAGETQSFLAVSTGGEAVGLLGGYKLVATPASTTVTANPSNPESEALVVAAFAPSLEGAGGMIPIIT